MKSQSHDTAELEGPGMPRRLTALGSVLLSSISFFFSEAIEQTFIVANGTALPQFAILLMPTAVGRFLACSSASRPISSIIFGRASLTECLNLAKCCNSITTCRAYSKKVGPFVGHGWPRWREGKRRRQESPGQSTATFWSKG